MSAMHLSITTWSFPSCTLAECAGIAKAIGIDALDVGLFYRSGLSRDAMIGDELLPETGETLKRRLFFRELDLRQIVLPRR